MLHTPTPMVSPFLRNLASCRLRLSWGSSFPAIDLEIAENGQKQDWYFEKSSPRNTSYGHFEPVMCKSGHLESGSGSESRHIESESRCIRIHLYFLESESESSQLESKSGFKSNWLWLTSKGLNPDSNPNPNPPIFSWIRIRICLFEVWIRIRIRIQLKKPWIWKSESGFGFAHHCFEYTHCNMTELVNCLSQTYDWDNFLTPWHHYF